MLLPIFEKEVFIIQSLHVISFCLGLVKIAGQILSILVCCPPPEYSLAINLGVTNDNLSFVVTVADGSSTERLKPFP